MLPEVDPEIRLGISAYFPDNYIPDANQRLYFYKRLASLRSSQELEELKEEIKDRFGPYGAVVENLFLVMNLRRTLETFPGAADQRLGRQSVFALSSRIAGQGGKTFRADSQAKEPFSPLARRAFIVCAAKPGMGAADGRSDGVARSIQDLPAAERFFRESLPA